MPRSYTILFLSKTDAARAYPLIQSASPNVSLEEWIAYFTRLSQLAESHGRVSGVVALESRRGYIHGLFSYCTGHRLGVGPILNVENFIAIDAGDRASAITSLIDAMERLAHDHGCATIHTDIPDTWATSSPQPSGLVAHLLKAGYDRESVRLSKST